METYLIITDNLIKRTKEMVLEDYALITVIYWKGSFNAICLMDLEGQFIMDIFLNIIQGSLRTIRSMGLGCWCMLMGGLKRERLKMMFVFRDCDINDRKVKNIKR